MKYILQICLLGATLLAYSPSSFAGQGTSKHKAPHTGVYHLNYNAARNSIDFVGRDGKGCRLDLWFNLRTGELNDSHGSVMNNKSTLRGSIVTLGPGQYSVLAQGHNVDLSAVFSNVKSSCLGDFVVLHRSNGVILLSQTCY